MKKRILPIVLVLVMLLSLLPAQVFAASYADRQDPVPPQRFRQGL